MTVVIEPNVIHCFIYSLAKLEEEFEKKFNSLPQYSPVTFDRKNAFQRKKKQINSGQTEQQKGNECNVLYCDIIKIEWLHHNLGNNHYQVSE